MKPCFSIELLIDTIGRDAARSLREHFGGHELHVPKTEAGATFEDIVQAVGIDAAHELVRVFAGESVYIAMDAQAVNAKNRRAIAELRAQGLTWRQIASRYTFTSRFSERWVRHLGLADQREERQRQAALLPEPVKRRADIPKAHPLDALFGRTRE
jgi:hypothetical protein